MRQFKHPTPLNFFKVPFESAVASARVLSEMLKAPEVPSNKEMLDSARVNPSDYAGGRKQSFQGIDPDRVKWEQFEQMGVSRESLEKGKHLDDLLQYRKTPLVPISIKIGEVSLYTDARLSLKASGDGMFIPVVHAIRKEPQLEREFFGHTFTDEDKKALRETGNLGRTVELTFPGKDEPTRSFVSIDRLTNDIIALGADRVRIPDEIKGVKLSDEQKKELSEGRSIYVEGMTSKAGKEFDATLQYSAERRGLEFIFPKNQIFNERSIGGVPLSPTQIKMLSEGHTILVEDMKFRNRNDTFSSFVTIDKVTGRPNYTRHNPETGEIYIPKEICNVQLTAEDKEVLRKGQAVYLENMINRKGEEFSAFVKLDMNTGRTMYSRTPDGFNEQQAPRIPAEVYGHVFTAQEKANLQDGKTLLVEGLKNNGQTFSSYLKVNPYSGQLQYFQENPDIRRDTSRRAAQTETAQGQQQEQKKGASQAV